MKPALLTKTRNVFHARLLAGPLTIDSDGIASIADRSSQKSRLIAAGVVTELGHATTQIKAAGQTAGSKFEDIVRNFVEETFPLLPHLRPGRWMVSRGRTIAQFEQFSHLNDLENLIAAHPSIRAALGGDYLISPDIVVVRKLESDETINAPRPIVDGESATGAVLRAANGGLPLLHASISCKWTLRSDRAQNVRTEAQNLLRNRKGRVPHILAVTAEPTAERIKSLAQGHADLDAVYHIALPELLSVVKKLGYAEELDTLEWLVQGKRLKDISDLPLDLAV